MANEITTYNHANEMRERILGQYSDSKNLKTYIDAFLAQTQEIENIYEILFSDFNIDDASNDLLDIVGELLDQSRVVDNIVLSPFFGPDAVSQLRGYGSASDPNNQLYLGGIFRGFNQATGESGSLNDEVYRTFLKSKIESSGGGTTVEEIIANFKTVLSLPDSIRVIVRPKTNNFNLGYNVTIKTILTDAEKAYIKGSDVIISTAGVPITYYDNNGQI